MKNILSITGLLLFTNYSSAAWMTNKQVDKMTDQKYIFFMTGSKEGFKPFGKKATLQIAYSCKEMSYSIFINHPGVVEKGPIKIRFDKNDAKSVYASRSSDMKSVVVGDESNKEYNQSHIIKDIESAKSIAIQYGVVLGGQQLAEFNVSGLTKELKKTEKLCK
jgi:hypothetical protein